MALVLSTSPSALTGTCVLQWNTLDRFIGLRSVDNNTLSVLFISHYAAVATVSLPRYDHYKMNKANQNNALKGFHTKTIIH